ncbi:MAG: D-alanine--D-alanine ligase, partial [Candidatus Omnitrophica bacterium CG07_land_8_20_14_0_80_50_8]
MIPSMNWACEKVAVLAGGTSCEREISLISGRAVLAALTAKGMPAILVDPAGDFVQTIKNENISMAFLALHGTFGEDGTIQRLFEKEGIAYTGSGVASSEKAFDKSRAQRLFQQAGLRVPEFRIVKKGETLGLPKKSSFPMVVKPASAGSSIGVSLVYDGANYEKAVSEAFRYSDSILIDRYIPGRELTVGMLGDEALPIGEVIVQRKFYDYQAKYENTGTRYEFPAKLSVQEARRVTEAAVKAYHTLGCEVMARVDVILGQDHEPCVLEVNTIPGLTGKSLLPKAALAAGIDFPSLCVKI